MKNEFYLARKLIETVIKETIYPPSKETVIKLVILRKVFLGIQIADTVLTSCDQLDED